MLRDSLQGFYYSLQVFYKALPENEKTFLYIKLRQTKYVYSPFLLPSSVLQLFFSFSVSSLFGTHQQLTHPPVKSSTLPLRNMPVFQSVAAWHKIFTSSCVIPLWDSATAHPPSGKELNPSSFNQSCFSGLIVYDVLILS